MRTPFAWASTGREIRAPHRAPLPTSSNPDATRHGPISGRYRIITPLPSPAVDDLRNLSTRSSRYFDAGVHIESAYMAKKMAQRRQTVGLFTRQRERIGLLQDHPIGFGIDVVPSNFIDSAGSLVPDSLWRTMSFRAPATHELRLGRRRAMRWVRATSADSV